MIQEHDFAELRERLAQAQAALADQKQVGQDETTREQLPRRAAQCARMLRNALDRPLEMAFVGPTSSGKSLLIGTLLGCPELLPDMKETPSTGNVTALRLQPVRDGEQPGFVRDGPSGMPVAEVALLPADDIASLVKEHVEGVLQVMSNRLGPDRIAALRAAAGRPGLRTAFAGIDEWLQRHWTSAAEEGSQGAEIGGVGRGSWPAVRALLDLRDACLAGGHLVGDVPLRVQAEPGALLTLRPPPRKPDRFEPFDRQRLDRSALEHGQDAGVLFPIIQRVTYRVRVAWWDNIPSDEHEVDVLDFPGLYGGGSAVRDTFLSRLGLGSVHSVAMCVQAGAAGTAAVEDLHQILEAAAPPGVNPIRRATLLATRFDAFVPPAGDDDFRELDNIKRLNDVLRNTFRGGADRIALVCTMWGILQRGLPRPSRSEQDAANVAEAERTARDRLPLWRRIAKRIEDDDPMWSRLLFGVTDAGGLDVAQQRLGDRCAKEGVAEKRRQANACYRELYQALQAIARTERWDGRTVDDTKADAASAFVRSLGNQLRDWKVEAAELSANDELLGGLAARARRRVVRWPHWEEISFEAVRGVVPSAASNGVTRRTDRTAELRTEFDKSVRAEAATAARQLRQSVGRWQDELKATLDQFEQRWDDDDQELPEMVERLAQRGDTNAPASAAIDKIFTLPDELKAESLRVLTPLRDVRVSASRFPLRPDHTQPWGPGSTNSDDNARHLSVVLRMRTNLADSAAAAVTSEVRNTAAKLTALVQERLDRLRAALPRLEPPDDWWEEDDVPVTATGPVAQLLDKWKNEDR